MIKELGYKENFEEIMIYAKALIDEMEATNVNVLIPNNELANCRQCMPLVYKLNLSYIKS